jgi:cytosine/adenosine deaminase-related metal-dependent hydrolase
VRPPLFDKLSQLWRRLLFYARRNQFDRELEEEMQFHLEMKAEENIAEGKSVEEARAMRKDNDLGSIEPGKLADLVVLDADPLADIRSTTRISAVCLGGSLLMRDAIMEALMQVKRRARS